MKNLLPLPVLLLVWLLALSVLLLALLVLLAHADPWHPEPLPAWPAGAGVVCNVWHTVQPPPAPGGRPTWMMLGPRSSSLPVWW